MMKQNRVYLARELVQRYVRIARPVPCEEVIVEHVDHDSSKPSSFATHQSPARLHNLVGIRETVDPTVQNNALPHARLIA